MSAEAAPTPVPDAAEAGPVETVAEKAKLYVATRSNTATQEGMLAFKKGDIISIISRQDSTADGVLQNGQQGWFEFDCVEEMHQTAVADVGTNTGKVSSSRRLLLVLLLC